MCILYFLFGENLKTANLSQLGFDWEFFYNYVCVKIKDMVLGVKCHYLK